VFPPKVVDRVVNASKIYATESNAMPMQQAATVSVSVTTPKLHASSN